METIGLSFEDYHFLMELQQELATQPNDGNADPVYWGVMERKCVPMPEGCGDACIYIGDGGLCETLEEACFFVTETIKGDKEMTKEWAERDHTDFDEVVDFIRDIIGITEARIVYTEEHSVLSLETGAFITKRACQDYIDNFGYNHSKPHSYAMTAFRNFELQRLLKILREGLNFTPAKSIWHKMTENADPKRFVVLSDGVEHISQRLRWPFSEFVRDSKKEGINYTRWAYQDEIMRL